jgi:hypothetical protein
MVPGYEAVLDVPAEPLAAAQILFGLHERQLSS